MTAPSPRMKVNSKQHPRRDVVVEGENAKQCGGHDHPALGDQQKAAAVDQIGESARGQDHQKYGKRRWRR